MSVQAQVEALVDEMDAHVRTSAMARVDQIIGGALGRAFTERERILINAGIAAGAAEALVFLQSKGLLP